MSVYSENITPKLLAERIAGYISDPSTIRVRVLEHLGRAPSIDECSRIRQRVMAQREKSAGMKRIKAGATGAFPCGHSRDDANTILRESGNEVCRTCRREMEAKAAAEYRARERERIAKEKQDAEDALIRAMAAGTTAIAGPRIRLTDETLDIIARSLGITVGELIGDNRERLYVDARAVAVMVFLKSGNSLPWIAKKLRRSCHSSIINLRDTWDIRTKRNPALLPIYTALTGT